jgi:hypothetical protein
LARAAISAARIGEPDKARRLIAELEQKFPGSPELNEAQKGLRP